MSANVGFRSAIGHLHRRLLDREITVSELCDNSINIVKQTKYLNAFVTLNEDEARQRARECDEILHKQIFHGNKNGDNGKVKQLNLSPLFGIPIGIKDNFCTRNLLTSCASRMLSNYVPPYDSTVVDRLCIQANAIMIGKTNLDEFAMGSSSATSYYGPTANPWKSFGQQHFKSKHDLQSGYDDSRDWYMAGGSSTGSAVAVATGACFAAIGTDTGGSNRHPASMVGIVGFKPSYGMISRFGLIPLAHSLDTVSILTRYVTDAEIVFDALTQNLDPNDLTTRSPEEYQPVNDMNKVIRIGLPKEFGECDFMSDEVFQMWHNVAKKLADVKRFEIVHESMPNICYATHCYTVLGCSEVASNMACYDGVKFGFNEQVTNQNHMRSSIQQSASPRDLTFVDHNSFYRANRDLALGDEVKKRIICGNYFLLGENRNKYYNQALKLRRLIMEDFERIFQRVDILLTPSTPTPALSYSEWTKKSDENQLFHEDFCLIPSNLSNTPAINLPVATSHSGMPLCVQIIGKKNQDKRLLEITKEIEAVLGYDNFLEFCPSRDQ